MIHSAGLAQGLGVGKGNVDFGILVFQDGGCMAGKPGGSGNTGRIVSRSISHIGGSTACRRRNGGVGSRGGKAVRCSAGIQGVGDGELLSHLHIFLLLIVGNLVAIGCSGGPMEAGRWKGENADLITAMIKGADTSVSDEEMTKIEQCACPGCGSCSGMFTANSMNSLTEAIGLSLPGNGTILATHKNRIQLFKDAARQIVKNAYAYYEDGDESVLPRNIATRDAFLNAMTLDIAMGKIAL